MAIQTVLGSIDKGHLGVTSPHEHIYIDLSGFYINKGTPGYNGAKDKVSIENLGILNRDPYALLDNLILDDEAVQTGELLRFKEAGGNSVVDVTTVGISRDPEKLYRASKKTGLNIICGTGYYVGTTHSEWIRSADEHTLADVMAGEITDGIDRFKFSQIVRIKCKAVFKTRRS